LPEAHSGLFCAQWTAMPRKSVCAKAGLFCASNASGEFAPNTVIASSGRVSNSIFATENAPTSQSARVNGTQGAGWILPRWSIICGVKSIGVCPEKVATGSVQYAKEDMPFVVPSGLK